MDDVLHLGVGHGLMTRNAKFLLVDGLRNRQAKSMPIGITGLLVRRYGVVNDSLHTFVGKKMLEGVTLLAEYRINMEDTVVVAWVSDERVLDVVDVETRNLASTRIVSIEILQPDSEGSSLDFVEAGIATLIREDVLASRAIVGDGTENIGKSIVVGGNGSGIAEGSEVLTRVEGVGGGVAEGASAGRGSGDDVAAYERRPGRL